MVTIAASQPDEALAAGRRVLAARQRVLTAIAAVFFAAGWLLAWLAPPALIALVRVCARAVMWCTAAAVVGWRDVRRGDG